MNPLLVPASALTVLGLVSRWHLSRRSPKPALDAKASEKAAALPIINDDWQWPIYDQFTHKYGEVELKKRDAGTSDEGEENGPFRVIYRREEHLMWPDSVQIILSSPPLCKIIEQYLPDDGDLRTLAEPSIDGRELYIVLDALKNHIISKAGVKCEQNGTLATENGGPKYEQNGLANGDSVKSDELTNGDGARDGCDAGKETEEGKVHLKHLLRFMEKEYRDVPIRVQRMREEKRVAWDVLWAFLPRGSTVVYSCDHSRELLHAVVSANYYEFVMGQGWLFLLELDIWEFDGVSYKKCEIRRQIRKYEGERSFVSLPVSPMEMYDHLGTPDMLEQRFLDNGKRYLDLTMRSSHRFMHYTGPLFQQRLVGNCFQLFKENADGRVMIDQTSFAKMNPDYPMGNAQPPTGSKFWVCRDDDNFMFEAPAELSTDSSMDESEVPEKNLIFAPGIVYGFSFTLKQWGAFAINGFRDISFDSSAFQELVMEPQVKGLVHNLVSEYISTPEAGLEPVERVDPISNKGAGCVFLCYGPPGTGKTLTAESIAETLNRPLWALSVSELGTTPSELEKTLFKVLDIAAAWRAVLLLDEADVYLEKRISGADLTRNAMTGVFLRMLEYYDGVLFLTTNRIGTFDEAFRSRISVFLRYPSLSTEKKEQIWKTLLDKTPAGGVPSDKLSELAALEINGREIRNAIHTAQTWARSKREPLELRHVQYVMGVVEDSLESLNDALYNAPAQN